MILIDRAAIGAASDVATGLAAQPSTSPDRTLRSGVESAVWLRRLRVSRFRNLGQGELRCDGRPVVLTGANGAGKTNLLEAISFLAPGRGLRRVRLSEVEQRGEVDVAFPAQGWAVAAEVMTSFGPRELGTGLEGGQRETAGQGIRSEDTPGGRERRVVKLDGAAVKGQRRLGEILSIIWLTPQMDSLFREAANGRRRFVDRLVYGFDPDHPGRVNAFEHAMRQRSRLLREGVEDASWLAALEDTMARHGAAIAAARTDLIDRLNRASAGVGAFPKAELTQECEVGDWLRRVPAVEVEDRIRAGLRAARQRDREVGGAAVGPHRGDLRARHLDKDQPAELCSTGEQKAMLISILLAYARLVKLYRGAAPLLLLDEVAAHLDSDRRRSLYEELLVLGTQAWLTGTDAEIFSAMGDAAQYISVAAGEMRPSGADSSGETLREFT